METKRLYDDCGATTTRPAWDVSSLRKNWCQK